MTWLLLVLTLAVFPLGVLAQVQPPMSCEDKLAIAEKTTLVVRDERDRWQSQLAAVWLRAEKAEADVARLQAELRAAALAKAPEVPATATVAPKDKEQK